MFLCLMQLTQQRIFVVGRRLLGGVEVEAVRLSPGAGTTGARQIKLVAIFKPRQRNAALAAVIFAQARDHRGDAGDQRAARYPSSSRRRATIVK